MSLHDVFKYIVKSPLGSMFWVHHHEMFQFAKRTAAAMEDDDIILDLGAGICVYKDFFTKGTYEACDMRLYNDNISFTCDATNIPKEDKRYSKIFCTQVLEHVNDPFAALSEMHRVLKDDGVLYLSTNMATEHHDLPHDYFRYTRYGLSRLAEVSNFEVVSITPQGGRGALIAREAFRYMSSTKRTIYTLPLMLLLVPLTAINFIAYNLFDKIFKDFEHTMNYECIFKKNAK